MAKRNSTPERRSPQAKFPYFRQLKVRKGDYDYQFLSRENRSPYEMPVPVPWVQIKGYWLNQAGFTIGTALTVEVQPGCIVLKTQPSSS